ncbi:biopolymer transporter ExbD [Porphyromonas uenonis]|uniref:ExbD/TolR family protein n=1 Tax=Porphyromonas uenonis TaxID=281920 RepID=UPI0026EB7B5D|nr:biopolymer transporter ExbD [Porphyromonas uenonis]
MGKFKQAGGRTMPELNTSSLPDLIFAFLFFIMMVTSIREVTPKVAFQNLPTATELTKLEEKSLVSFIYVGKPIPELQAKFGTAPAIQLNDQITTDPSAVYGFVKDEEAQIQDERRKLMTVSIKGDASTKMKIIADIKHELRRADALNISYSARPKRDN